MGRTVVVRLVTGTNARGRLAARLHDVETGQEQVVRDADELVAALADLAAGTTTDRYDEADLGT
jgi:hypothetical protein